MKAEGVAHLNRERPGAALLRRRHLSREHEQCRYVGKCPGKRGQLVQRPEMGPNFAYSRG